MAAYADRDRDSDRGRGVLPILVPRSRRGPAQTRHVGACNSGHRPVRNQEGHSSALGARRRRRPSRLGLPRPLTSDDVTNQSEPLRPAYFFSSIKIYFIIALIRLTPLEEDSSLVILNSPSSEVFVT